MGRVETKQCGVWRRWRLLALWPAIALAGCHVVSIEQDRAERERRSGAFDAAAYVSHQWAGSIAPALERRAIPYAAFASGLSKGLAPAARAHGYRAGEGSAWTFVIAAEGVVTAIDRSSRQGFLRIAPAGAPAGAPPLDVQIGPVVAGTVLRDAVPAMRFDDFSGQVAYAEVGEAITRRAMAGAARAATGLRPGAHVRVVGAVALRRADDPVLLTPLTLDATGGGA
jgi:predicted lipoprotein